MPDKSISIVTPTFHRPAEVRQLLENLATQTVLPREVIIVDGAPNLEDATETVVRECSDGFPFEIVYIRHSGGTAIQRNAGVEAARGRFVSFIDDDVRLEPDFFHNVMQVYCNDQDKSVGGIVGYRTNRYFSQERSKRWRWYKRLKLLKVFEPGKYDFDCGYPINNNLQAPFTGTREVDFMTTACAVWRREVFDDGLRFDTFFRDYGVLEDAHFSLRAGRNWKLQQSGDARCEELHSPNGRVDRRKIGYKCVVNYYFVFRDIIEPLTVSRQIRFWRFQIFEFFRIFASAVVRRNRNDLLDLRGRIDGVLHVIRGIE